MDFTGRRQSDNVDDRRNNWWISEHFRTPEKTGRFVTNNSHTDAVERSIESIRGLRKNKDFSQDEFDFYLETEPLASLEDETVLYDDSVIQNVIRDKNKLGPGNILRQRRPRGQ